MPPLRRISFARESASARGRKYSTRRWSFDGFRYNVQQGREKTVAWSICAGFRKNDNPPEHEASYWNQTMVLRRKGEDKVQNFGMSMLWFWTSYLLVTTVWILHTVFNIYVLHMKPMDDTSMGEGYEKTKPWHPLYNIICFSIFGFLYIRGLENPTLTEALITGGIWSGICIAFDVRHCASGRWKACSD